jgi:uncharacterized membrane protein YheB (UPF0754 family)
MRYHMDMMKPRCGGDRVYWGYVIMPVIGAVIGWITNVLAICMLFRPYRPIRIGSVSLQGLLPRRQKELAKVVGETVSQQLLPQDKLTGLLTDSSTAEHLSKTLAVHVQSRLEEKLPKFLPQALRNYLVGEVVQGVDREFRSMLPQVMGDVNRFIDEEVNVARTIEETIVQFDLRELEKLTISVMGTELRYIEFWGAVFGGLIGLAQSGVMYLLQ